MDRLDGLLVLLEDFVMLRSHRCLLIFGLVQYWVNITSELLIFLLQTSILYQAQLQIQVVTVVELRQELVELLSL